MPSKAAIPTISEDAVRTRAYLMWEADGRPDGRAEHYWGLAAAEVAVPGKPKRAAASKAKPAPEKKAKPAKPVKSPAKAKPAKSAKAKKTKA